MWKKCLVLIALCVGILTSQTAAALSFDSFMNIFKLNDKPTHHKIVNHPGTQHNNKEPAQVDVGIYVLHVGKYDLQSASTRVDFYLIFRCKSACENIKFELMNATSWNSQLVAKQNGYLLYRVVADLNKAGNLHNYPFDSHTLDIVIENRQLTTDKMVFEVDPNLTALDPDLKVVGFSLLPTWTADVSNHYYKIFQQDYSRYKFTIYINRPWLAGFLKGILPALIIVICNFLALLMRIDHLSQRLGIATSTLIAAEVFHLNLTSSIPPLGYVTYADVFMLLNYVVLVGVLAEVVMTTHFIETKHHNMAVKINRICAWFIPLFWLVVQTINWLVFDPAGLFSPVGV